MSLPRPRLPKTRRGRVLLVLSLGTFLLCLLLARPVSHLALTAWRDRDEVEALPAGFVDDASRLNRTAVAAIWEAPADSGDFEADLARLLADARAESRKVSIGGARHSMGGHTISPGGVALDMRPHRGMTLDEETELLTVQAGATWADVIAHLDPRGRSVGVMQSNNSFSVGGSLSVNCHGWQYDRPPIASTVESFRLMTADGRVVRCGRTENAELFSLVLGGYGLFGVMLDAELRVVPNERYRLERSVVPAAKALAALDAAVAGEQEPAMIFARMNVAPDAFLEEVVLSAFLPEDGPIPPLSEPGLTDLARTVFRGSQGSAYGKELRWTAETELQPRLAGTVFSRNQLLNTGVELFQNRSAGSTDILHEYFVPRSRVAGFVDALREVIPRHRADLLNVTVRSVNEDPDTFLRYADGRMLAFVMLFSQNRTDAAERAMAALTEELIDAALAHDGRYYLPYRLHATPGQFHRAYPMSEEFFALKRRYDPDGLFQNQFALKYGPR